MIYKYDTRYIVTYSNGNRASFSKKRYGPLLEKISLLSEKIDHKIWNYFEISDNIINIFYWDQKTESIKIIIIDNTPENYELLYNYYWQLNHNGYPQTRTNGKKIYLYHLIMNSDKLIDHKDHNPLNNMKNNLRICDSYSDNNINLSLSSKNTSGYTGVSFIKGKWRARIQFKGTEHTEFFSSKEKAIECRQKWEKELRGF